MSILYLNKKFCYIKHKLKIKMIINKKISQLLYNY